MPASTQFILETTHFALRPCTLGDVAAYLSFWNDPEVMRFIGDGTWGGGEDKVVHFLQKNIAEYVAEILKP